MTLSWPVQGTISQYFGTNPASYQPNGHTGVDFAIPTGTPVLAADSGNIVFEGWATNLSASNEWWIAPAAAGIAVVINHNDGYVSLYGHLNESIVNNGDFVEKGQLIGYSGNTGMSTGPHLHFEVMGWPLQPYNGFYGRLNLHNGLVNGFAGDAAAPAPTLLPHQRITAAPTNQRTAPNRNGSVLKTFDSDVILDFKGWVQGENVDGHDVWFVGAYSDTYFWSGAFTDTTLNGIPDLRPAPPAPAPAPQPAPIPAPAPAPEPTPVQPVIPPYTFTPAFEWVEVIPAARPNFQGGNFPADPTHAVIHQFGTPGVDTIGSTINTFTNPNMERVASSHFVVSGNRIVQMVSLDDRAYHAGSVGNNFIGIETDPAQDAATIASTRKLLAALNKKYGYTLTLIRHKDVAGNATSCGSLIDLDKYKVTPEPTPVPVEPAPINEAKVIEDFQTWQRNQYLKR